MSTYVWIGKAEEEIEDGADDPINPSHYTDGAIETSDYIADKKLNFFLGNVVKYVSRAGKKKGVDPLEDLKKARWYLDREIRVRELLKTSHDSDRPVDEDPK